MVAVVGTRRLWWLLALWLQLRWHAQRQQERHRYLVAIARTLPEGSQIDEGQPDGTWLRLTVDRPQASKAGHG